MRLLYPGEKRSLFVQLIGVLFRTINLDLDLKEGKMIGSLLKKKKLKGSFFGELTLPGKYCLCLINKSWRKFLRSDFFTARDAIKLSRLNRALTLGSFSVQSGETNLHSLITQSLLGLMVRSQLMPGVSWSTRASQKRGTREAILRLIVPHPGGPRGHVRDRKDFPSCFTAHCYPRH